MSLRKFPLLQLSRIALMEHFVWLVGLWGVLAEWRSASMECGEQCVIMTGITMMPELCADSWATVVEVSSFIGKRISDVVRILCYHHE